MRPGRFEKGSGKTTPQNKELAGSSVRRGRTIVWVKFDDLNPQSSEDTETGLAEENEIPNDSYMVLVDPGDNVGLGTSLDLLLVDRDPSKSLYMPYQKRSHRKMQVRTISFILSMVASLLVLQLSMDVPIVFASSSQVETVAALSWYCHWISYDDDDDETSESAKVTNDCCSIPWHVAWSYNVFLGFIVAVQVGYFFTFSG